MAEFVVLSVGQLIGKLLHDEVNFLRGVKGKVEDLQTELRLIQRLLSDADSKHEHDQAVGEWLTQLRDIAYDAEDVIEQYILRVALKKGQNIKSKWVQVREVGSEIDGLKSRISNLRISMETYGIHPQKGDRRRTMPEEAFAHFEEEFVGRKESVELLVTELLKEDREQLRVISICGMGGLGKTRLAKKVFAHDKVRKHFDGFAWASLSREHQERDILEGIFLDLNPNPREEVTKIRREKLLEKIYKIQKDERCIVVLDDIWTIETWNNLRNAFPVKDTRSKLLITTRNTQVARDIDRDCFLHVLPPLLNPESWDLLKKHAFRKAEGIATSQAVEGIARQSEMKGHLPAPEITKEMKSLGDKLLEKCEGLPLAVIVLGRLLAFNKWETVYEKINLLFICKRDISKVLALSYDDLPSHLKPCFLYLASFPEAVEIPATEVLHMWIAEGFVLLNAYEEQREIQVEDVAEQYLTELVNRGMVQARFNLSGKIKTCRLHNLMRELCISKATRESFVSILNSQLDNETDRRCCSLKAKKVELTCKTRRLSLNLGMMEESNMIRCLKPKGRNASHLRTLMFFGSIQGKWKHLQPFFIHCKFLRVLKLEDLYWTGKILPRSVGDLVHLRFLSLARSSFMVLPQSMRNLVFMEFLDLNVTARYNAAVVPDILWKMRRLTYLRLPYLYRTTSIFFRVRKKLKLNTLKSLRTLRNFCPKTCDVNDISKLPNLQKLTIVDQYDSDKMEIISQLAKFTLKHLQSSSFRFWSEYITEGDLNKMSSYLHPCKLFIGGKIEKFPGYNTLPQQLRKLILVWSGLEEDPMPILEKLEYLIVLMLVNHAFLGEKMVCSAGGFPKLKHLILHKLPNVEECRVDEGAMPHLSQPGISECPNLRWLRPGVSLPSGVSTNDSRQKIFDAFGLIKRIDCRIYNKSELVIKLIPKSHWHGDPRFSGIVRRELVREIQPNKFIDVDSRNYDLNGIGFNMPILIHFAAYRNGVEASKKDLIFFPERLREMAEIHLTCAKDGRVVKL